MTGLEADGVAAGSWLLDNIVKREPRSFLLHPTEIWSGHFVVARVCHETANLVLYKSVGLRHRNSAVTHFGTTRRSAAGLEPIELRR